MKTRFRFAVLGACVLAPMIAVAGDSRPGEGPEPCGLEGYEEARRLGPSAEALIDRPELAAALDAALRDPGKRATVLERPDTLLDMAGLGLPEGLALDAFERAPASMPFPDWTPFLVELTSCRKYYRWECSDTPPPNGSLRSCKLVEEEVCLGIRIRPRTWPVGPYRF
jgi:hypothetical protein